MKTKIGAVAAKAAAMRRRLAVLPLAVAAYLTVSVGEAFGEGLNVTSVAPAAPPGADVITKGMSWGMWGASLAIYGAVAMHSVRLAHAHRQNGGGGIGEHAKGIAGALGAATAIGMAPSLINGLAS